MRNNRPFLGALMWMALGTALGFALMLAWNAYRASQSKLSDEALDAQARHERAR
ncbi:MAG: hypothetical protein V4499_02875 [Pseudomonadota bacterium]